MSNNIKPEDLWDKPTKSFEKKVMSSIDAITDQKAQKESGLPKKAKQTLILIAAALIGAIWLTTNIPQTEKASLSSQDSQLNQEVESFIYASVMDSSDLYNDYIDSEF